MKTKYKIITSWLRPEITKIEILRETESFIFIAGYNGKEDRRAKATEHYAYFDTWEAAHSALLTLSDNAVRSARRRLEEANGTYGNIKGMKKP